MKIIDLSKIGEDKLVKMDGFREASLHFREFGCYTKLTPNPHPNSPYMKFWKEERRRSIYGLNLGYDWIPGYYYFYLNYSPIEIAKSTQQILEDGSSVRGERSTDFPHIWDSDYYYFHYLEEAEKAGEHGSVIKTRGRGYSYKAGSMLNRNYFLIPRSKSYAAAWETEYLTSDGILTKAWDNMDFIDTYTAWSKKRHYKNQDMHKRASYQTMRNGVKTEKGYKSEIIGISLKDNPSKIRGKRGKLILFEEAGKFPCLLEAWQIARPSMEQGKITFGLMIAFGTGGTESADFMALEELFYNPKGYKVHAITNVWSKDRHNTKSGYFIPEYMNYEGCYDKDGNSDIEKAKRIEEIERKNIKDSATNPQSVIRYIAEKPFDPEEAVLRVSGTLFPVNLLKEQLSLVETNPKKYTDSAWVGKLISNPETNTIDWRPDDKVIPIVDFPLYDDKNIDGAVVIYEQPYRNEEGKIPYGLYISGNDPYDHDESTTSSLGSTFIMNSLTERIVAEYTGRPQTAEQYYESVRKLLIYYNAICNYENNLKGLYTYFHNRNQTYLLADTPKILIDQDMMKESSASRKKGTPATQAVNKYGRELIKTWLVKPTAMDSEKLNLHTIRSRPLLKELIYWNPDPKSNFDRVSALGMLLILKEDMAKIVIEKDKRVKELARDPFWDRPFKSNSYRSRY